MFFIQRNITKQFLLELFNLAVSLNGDRIVLWRDININNNFSKKLWNDISVFDVKKQTLEAVTLYDDDDQLIKAVDSYKFSHKIASLLISRYETFTEIMESISFYKKNHKKWFMSMIFHENMTLLRLPHAELKKLDERGISYSKTPDNW